METDPSPDAGHRGSRTALLALVGSAAAVLIAGAALFITTRDDDDTVGTADGAVADAAATTTTPTTAAPTTTGPATTTAPATTAAPADGAEPIDLSVWTGRYSWSEAVEGTGSDPFVIHELTLDAVTNGGGVITGRLEQNGFQISTDLRIRALPAAGGIMVELVEVDRGKGIEVPGDVLFELSGDPVRPLTTLRELLTLRVDHPESGTYFLPAGDTGGELAEGGAPASFWAIEDETFDLVRVETSTG